MRIVHAIRSDGFAGVERHVASLAAAQAECGHSVAVIGGDLSAMRAAIAHPLVSHRPAATVVETAHAIDTWSRADLLHVHMTAAEIAALFAARSWRLPVVSTRHFARTRMTGSAGRLVAGVVRRRIDAQISISAYVAAHIEGDSTVIPAGVHIRADARPAADRRRVVLIAQRLEAEKRTDVAIRAFGASRLSGRGWRLVIAGDGAERPRLEALARELDLADAVRFLGRRRDIDRLMQEASVLLAPCPVEGLGLAVLEAMAHGLPVVGAGAGGHLETVGAARRAALYAPLDAQEAGGLLDRLARDDDERDEYGRELQAVQRTSFTPAAQASATDVVYRSVL